MRKFKEAKKQFDKVSEEKEAALIKNAQAPRNKQHEVEEATNILSATRNCFRNIVLDYVLQVGPARGGPTWALHLASRAEAVLETERASSYWKNSPMDAQLVSERVLFMSFIDGVAGGYPDSEQRQQHHTMCCSMHLLC